MTQINSGLDYVDNFVNTIAPMICEVYLQYKAEDKKVVNPSVVIAQACVESGYNLNASTLFGIKGEGVECHTSEFINGEYVEIVDSFATYPTILDSIYGYFDLMQWSNYDRVTETTDRYTQTIMLKECGYATSPTYNETLNSVMDWLSLELFDDYVFNYNYECEEIPQAPVEETILEDTTNTPHYAVPVTDDNNNVYDCNGTLCHCWHDKYEIIDINDNGVCLGVEGVVFARIPTESVIFL